MFFRPKFTPKPEHRVGPRPYAYGTAKMDRFGVYRFTDQEKESAHLSIGRDGWAPIVYLCAILASRTQGATSALCRYFDLAGVVNGVAMLEGWDTRHPKDLAVWAKKRQEDETLFFGERDSNPRTAIVWACGDTGARAQLTDLLYALAPPHRSIVLACSKISADFHALPEHKAFREQLRARYEWLLGFVRKELEALGYVTEGPLVKIDGYKAGLFDDFDIYNF